MKNRRILVWIIIGIVLITVLIGGSIITINFFKQEKLVKESEKIPRRKEQLNLDYMVLEMGIPEEYNKEKSTNKTQLTAQKVFENDNGSEIEVDLVSQQEGDGSAEDWVKELVEVYKENDWKHVGVKKIKIKEYTFYYTLGVSSYVSFDFACDLQDGYMYQVEWNIDDKDAEKFNNREEILGYILGTMEINVKNGTIESEKIGELAIDPTRIQIQLPDQYYMESSNLDYFAHTKEYTNDLDTKVTITLHKKLISRKNLNKQYDAEVWLKEWQDSLNLYEEYTTKEIQTTTISNLDFKYSVCEYQKISMHNCDVMAICKLPNGFYYEIKIENDVKKNDTVDYNKIVEILTKFMEIKIIS